MLNKKTIEDINVTGKRVLVRCDFNVPLDENRHITDETRIDGALPTIKYLINNGAKVILCSHMGKPKSEPKPELSLAPVAKALSEKLGKEVVFAADDNVVGNAIDYAQKDHRHALSNAHAHAGHSLIIPSNVHNAISTI